MKNYFDKLTALRIILIISLFLTVAFITGFGISCQSQSPAPPAPSPGLPKESAPEAPPATPPQMEVSIEGSAFKPDMLNIPTGTTVIWYNNDSVTHTVTARDNSFDSGSLSRDDSFSYTFEQKGTYEYYCAIHPFMEGKVVVE